MRVKALETGTTVTIEANCSYCKKRTIAQYDTYLYMLIPFDLSGETQTCEHFRGVGWDEEMRHHFIEFKEVSK